MNKNNLIKTCTLLTLFCSLVIVVLIVSRNLHGDATFHEVEEDYEAIETRNKENLEEFEELLYVAHAESQFNVSQIDEISAYTPNLTESFANGNLRGYWQRTKVRLSDQDHKTNFGPTRGVRTKKTIYDPENQNVYVLSMTGEVFYGESLSQYAGIAPTNPKVIVKPQSFCGVNKPNGDFILCGGIHSSSNQGNMFYSEDKGLTWKKSSNASFTSVDWATSTETNRIVMVCRTSDGLVIKESRDFGASYTNVDTVTEHVAAVKTTRVFNTDDQCDILILLRGNNQYHHYVYKNDTFTKQPNLPPLKIKGPLYSAKVDNNITYAYMANVTPFELRIYNEDWQQVDVITKSANHNAQGIVLPFGENIILSRWPAPKYFDKTQDKWINFNSASSGYDAHSIQFFKKKDGNTLMFNNCDNGMRFKEVGSLADVKSSDPPFNYLDNYHYYAELHGGDAHPDGHLVAAYQDQGTELLVKQNDGTYEAIKLGGPDGLESTISKNGTGVWYRHYWQQCWFHKINNGQKGKKYTVNLDLGAKWITPRMELTHIPGEESIYMGGKNNVIKLTYNPSLDKVEKTELAHTFSKRVKTVVAAAANPDKLYLSTHEGRFYYSNDRGVSWTESEFTKTQPFVPSNQNFGGWAGEVIKVPKDKPNWVYFSNNRAGQSYGKCMLSTDGGVTFTDISNGIEGVNRLRDMAVSADGEVAFSTSYHVYFKKLGQWFPIRGSNFISGAVYAKNVVYLEDLNVVRFFTASAGVVDFNIEDINVVEPCVTTISSFPYSESFETGEGNWQQSLDDDIDWTPLSGSTPSSYTGPSAAIDGNMYFYVESSYENHPNKTAVVTSPCFDFHSLTAPVLRFNYHMYGKYMGSLNLEVSTNRGGTWESVWNISGNQRNDWHEAEIDLSSYAGAMVNLRFKGITGTSYTSDIAIDNIRLDEQVVRNSMLLTSITGEQNNPKVTLGVYPNPNNGLFKLELSSTSAEQLTVELYNNSGQLVFRNEYEKAEGKFQKQVDIRNEMPGQYILRVICGNDIVVERLTLSE
ncbi:MAG: T9SS type A sorting domain-containing protein [Bacteroidales bacterium]|nr:T9SS type A sorting domain-containing protein [Bacteroidales bacterium]